MHYRLPYGDWQLIHLQGRQLNCFASLIKREQIHTFQSRPLSVFAKSFQYRLKFLAGQNKILQDRRLVCYQITISFCQKSQDICQTNWNFLQDRMKICRFCQTVLSFSRRLPFTEGAWCIEKQDFLKTISWDFIDYKQSMLCEDDC